jgi:decaprenylphospho-beta-D-ribofuranose 2-oxidase
MLPGMQVELTNWTKSAHSPCWVYQVSDIDGIIRGLAAARAQHLSVLPHGAGHSYTDAALNSGGVVLDLTPMHQILDWDAAQGVLRVEPGVTMHSVVEATWKDGWWPLVSPSTPDATIGGCAAMNVNGRNAWKCGPFGASILAMDVLLTNGEVRTLSPKLEPQLFQAFVGSMGLLGIITAVTLQLQRTNSGLVSVRKRPANSLDEIFSAFADEEQDSDFMEAWLDGFAHGDQLGRGLITCAVWDHAGKNAPAAFSLPGKPGQAELPLSGIISGLGRPVLPQAVQLANRANYWGHRWTNPGRGQPRQLYPFTYWAPAAFAGYHTLFPEGAETFQAFVPDANARATFKQLLRYTQQQGCIPLWCVIKKHRGDPFLLSYQVDGFSLELNYQRTRQNAVKLQQVLQTMIPMVIAAGGRFYLAKDHFLTHAQYCQSMGDEAVDTFLALKQRLDPEMLLQSDLFQRVFQPQPSMEKHLAAVD